MAQAKPSMQYLWSETGEIITPPNSKIQEGWVSEKPPYQTFNWELNRADQFLKHIDENGLPEWSAGVTYQKGSIALYNDEVCESLQDSNIGNAPGTAGWWTVIAYVKSTGGDINGDITFVNTIPSIIFNNSTVTSGDGMQFKASQETTNLKLQRMDAESSWVDMLVFDSVGIVTFASPPKCVVTPSHADDLARKGYVDTQITQYFPAGTRLSFHQASAPAGWSQDVSVTDAMLRVVSGAGGGAGGVDSAILNNKVPSHTHTGNTGNQSENHTHQQRGIYGLSSNSGGNSIAHKTGTDDCGQTLTNSTNHTHGFMTDVNLSAANWTPKYVDMIICERD